MGQFREQMLIRPHVVRSGAHACGDQHQSFSSQPGRVPQRIDVEVVSSLVGVQVSRGGGGTVGVGLARGVRVGAGGGAGLPGQLLQFDAALVHAAPFLRPTRGPRTGTPPTSVASLLMHNGRHNAEKPQTTTIGGNCSAWQQKHG